MSNFHFIDMTIFMHKFLFSFYNNKVTGPPVFSTAYNWKKSSTSVFIAVAVLVVCSCQFLLHAYSNVFYILTYFSVLNTGILLWKQRATSKTLLIYLAERIDFPLSIVIDSSIILEGKWNVSRTCCNIPCICQPNLTNSCLYKMPRTKGDKCIGGIDYISKLSHHHGCKSFSGGITTCSCILNYQDKLPEVYFFKRKLKSFGRLLVV